MYLEFLSTALKVIFCRNINYNNIFSILPKNHAGPVEKLISDFFRMPKGQNVSIFGIHGNQSSNIIAKLEKCLTLRNKMTNRHKCVDISLYSIRSINTNLKSCTHPSLVLCLDLVSMATWILLLAWNCTFWPFLNDSCWDRKYQKGWILF